LIFLRSLVFNLVFYVALVIWMIFALPTFLMPRPALMALVDLWARSNTWLLRIICGVKVEYRGVEKIPKGPLIVAAKHQSMWETFGLLQFFDHPLYILKRELEWLPLFGQYLRKAEMIGIDRNAGGKALLAMMRRAREAVREGGQLIIFPEGTRHRSGSLANPKRGVGRLALQTGAPILPTAVIGTAWGQYGGIWAQDDARKSARIAGATILADAKLAIPGSVTRFAQTHPADDTEAVTQLRQVLSALAATIEVPAS